MDPNRSTTPLALWRLHAASVVGERVDVDVRLDTPTRRARWVDLVAGAGFSVASGRRPDRLVRERSLADTVGPRLRLLVCGLNPSLFAADAGVGFARPGNRFWPAALAAEIVTRDRDPLHALRVDRVGMTDLVKRSTPRAEELSRDEYLAGVGRLTRLVTWLRPGAVCFVGLAGWRAARDRKAAAGWQPRGIGGVPAYVMPSTSGLNARVPRDELAAHLRAAASGDGPTD